MSVKAVRDGFPKLKQDLAMLLKVEVVVGIADGSVRRPTAAEPNPPPNALIGYIMETGDPARNIPARPFLVPGAESAGAAIVHDLGVGAVAAMLGDRAGLVDALQSAGQAATAAVQNKITSGSFAPLSSSTLAARRRARNTSTDPLRDTLQLLEAITSEVRDKG